MASLEKRIDEKLLNDIAANNREDRQNSIGQDFMI